MQRILVVLGLVLLLVGLFWPWLAKLPFGRLPGDLFLERENFSFYFPLTTGFLLSVIVSIIVWFLRK